MARFESLIAANKFKSAVLVGGFIVLYTAAVFLVVMGVFGLAYRYGEWEEAFTARPMLVGLLAAHAGAVFLVLCSLAAGPGMVLATSGARPVRRQDDPELHNVVEEMALASGLPMPAIYRMESPALNALATAGGRKGVAVAVTRGLRETLTRDQLQAVVAHEIARIRNQDILLMTLIASLVGLVLLFSRAVRESGTMVFREVKTVAAGSDDPRGVFWGLGVVLVPAAIVAIALAPLWALAPIFLRLAHLAVSRERLFLADAEAARLTRYPEALAQALERVAGDTQAVHPACRATAHLFFVQPVLEPGQRPSGASVWHSHPSIEERVARLRSIGNVEEGPPL